MSRVPNHFIKKAVLLFISATLLGLFFATQSYLAYLYRDGQANFLATMSVTMPDWYVWACFVPILVWLSRRFPLDTKGWLKYGLIHFGLGFLITVIKMMAVTGFTNWVSFLPARAAAISQLHPNYITYWVIIGLCHAFDYYRKYRERELKTSQLETRLAQSQLQLLKMQLHPHFLFNTLHAISTLMHRNVEAADRMMAQLSDFLRLTLENSGVQLVTLKTELEFLQSYLEIEKTRFQDRLTIKLDVDAAVLDSLVPNLILQPLVENAVRYGVQARSGAGEIEISAKRRNGMIDLRIRDDGPGLENDELKEGVGLQNTRARLENLYGKGYRFELVNNGQNGMEVWLEIPLQKG